MPAKTHGQAAILYEHPLLGEGIAMYLRHAVGVCAVLAPVSDRDAVRRTLALDPRVVIFERGGALRAQDVAVLAPHAAIIDVTGAVCQGMPREGLPVDLARIASAVLSRLEDSAGAG